MVGHPQWFTYMADSQCCRQESHWGCQPQYQHVVSPAWWSQGSQTSSLIFSGAKSPKRTRQSFLTSQITKRPFYHAMWAKKVTIHHSKEGTQTLLMRGVARSHCRRACQIEDSIVEIFDKYNVIATSLRLLNFRACHVGH